MPFYLASRKHTLALGIWIFAAATTNASKTQYFQVGSAFARLHCTQMDGSWMYSIQRRRISCMHRCISKTKKFVSSQGHTVNLSVHRPILEFNPLKESMLISYCNEISSIIEASWVSHTRNIQLRRIKTHLCSGS